MAQNEPVRLSEQQLRRVTGGIVPEVHNIYKTGMGFSHWESRMRAEGKLL